MSKNSSLQIFKGIGILLISILLLTAAFKFAVTSKISFGADFSIYWQAGRALFLHGVSPYASSTTQIIQEGIYGRLAKAGEDQVRYAYPPFSLLVILPSVWMSYPWAQAYWMAFNLTAIFAAVWAVSKRPPLWLLAGLIFFYPVSRGIILGQFALIIGAVFLFAYALMLGEGHPSMLHQWLAGILLAWCAMKPQLSALIILFFLLAALQKKEGRVFAGFALGLLIFAGISWIFVPTWVTDWIHLIFDYVGYVPIRPVLQSWVTSLGLDWHTLWLQVIFAALGVGGILWVLFRWWRRKFPDFIALGWLILVGQLINPNPNSLLSDQIVFLLPVLLWILHSSASGWMKKSIWWGFILIPWILFAVYFHGKEPYEAASGLALVFVSWWLGILIHHLLGSSKSFKNEELKGIS